MPLAPAVQPHEKPQMRPSQSTHGTHRTTAASTQDEMWAKTQTPKLRGTSLQPLKGLSPPAEDLQRQSEKQAFVPLPENSP